MIGAENGNSSDVQNQISSLSNQFSEYFSAGILHVSLLNQFLFFSTASCYVTVTSAILFLHFNVILFFEVSQ